MSIKLARTAGFCMGVKRAMEIVLKLARRARSPIYTDGPLIHNPQIIALLNERGIESFKEGERPLNGIIVIRAHGVSPQRRQELKRVGLPIHDATCPDVAKVQAIVKKYSRLGYEVVIVGDRGHAEVEGLLGFTGNRGLVISNIEEARALSPMEKVCIVAQTTQDLRLFDGVVNLIKERSFDCVVFNTICRSTRKRQREIINLARRVDAIIVVGGKNSANTARLASICEGEGTAAFHVESEKEIENIPLSDFKRIGITAGASTPNWVIERVVEKTKSIHAERRPALARRITLIFRGIIRSYLVTALAAVFLYAAACLLQGVAIRWEFAVALGGCILSVHLANRLVGSGFLPQGEATLALEYYRDNRNWLIILSAVSGIVGMLCAALVASNVFLFFCALIVINFSYCAWATVRSEGGQGNKWGIGGVPVFNGIFVSLTWMLAIVLMPGFAALPTWTYQTVAACFYVFGLVFIRATFHDIRSINADTIAGKETIPILVGMRWTRRIMGAILTVVGILILTAPVPLGLRCALAMPLFYIVLYLYLCHRRLVMGGLLCDFLDDGQFFVAGISALLWQHLIFIA